MNEILKNPVLQGLTEEEILNIQQHSCMRKKTYKKDELILHAGDYTNELGIVLSGKVLIENIDLWDNKTILSSISPGQVFAETYALLNTAMMVDAVAGEDSSILFLNVSLLLRDDFAEFPWQRKLMKNLIAVAVGKNLTLSNRIFCTSSKKIRGRLLTYLSGMAVQTGKTEFDIPFDRQQLADYLNLDRSALSKELCLMRDEGLLSFRKNHFHLFVLPA